MADNFFPKEYNENKGLNEKGGGYMKFIQGVNRFRILEKPIFGWEWWEETEDGKRTPKRVKITEKIDMSQVTDPDSVKRFWAMVVYNYQDKKIQILEITQKGIQKAIESMAADEEWGTPVQKYDIVVTKTGEKLETEYSVMPKPKTDIDDEILKNYEDLKINVEALYKGDDPFKAKKEAEEKEGQDIADSVPF